QDHSRQGPRTAPSPLLGGEGRGKGACQAPGHPSACSRPGRTALACRRFPPGPRWVTMTVRPQARPSPPRSDPTRPRLAQPAPTHPRPARAHPPPARYDPPPPTPQPPAMTFRNTLRTRWATRLAASLALWLDGSTAGAAASEANAAPAVPARVEFNRDVRP